MRKDVGRWPSHQNSTKNFLILILLTKTFLVEDGQRQRVQITRVGGDTRGWAAEWHSAKFSSFVLKNKRMCKGAFTDKKISIPKLEYRNPSLFSSFKKLWPVTKGCLPFSRVVATTHPLACIFSLFLLASIIATTNLILVWSWDWGKKKKERGRKREKNEETKARGRKGSILKPLFLLWRGLNMLQIHRYHSHVLI